jgi:hypothetical protein
MFQTLNLQQWDFFFFLAFFIGLYSIHRLAAVKEVGEVKEKVIVYELVSEIRRGVSTISTTGNVRRMAQFPFLLMRSLFRNRR